MSTEMVAHTMVTTQFELDGFRVVRNLGVVRGIVVRSRSIFGTLGASLQTILGGNITLLTNLCEKTRSDAFNLMLEHAAQLGATPQCDRSGRAIPADSRSARSRRNARCSGGGPSLSQTLTLRCTA